MKVKIYQPTKSATQSGKKSPPWILSQIEDINSRDIDPIMGWTSSSNTLAQIRLEFQNSEDAAIYAKSQGWKYEIFEPKEAKITPKSYVENFISK
ncbi:MAG: hypothetical protein ACJA0S_001069 [Rickettsiales bacterium]|jgi:hypothetical protein